MRSLPLTDKARAGGRPRETRAPRNAFADWLAGCEGKPGCGMTPEEVATALKVSPSSVYNARNGYFKPGRDLAVRIAELSKGAVPVDSWTAAKGRPRKKRAA